TYRLGKHKLFIHEYLGDSILDEYEKSNIEYIESISSIHSIREVKNVTSLDKIDENEYEHIVIATGEEHYDRLLGGTRMGELTILTGTPGSGKSTYLNQLVVKAREKGEGSLLYSGELRSELLKSKIYEVCAGKENLEITKNTFNENITVRKIRNKSITKKIGNWVRDKIHILEYDFMAYDTDILSAIEETYCKKGIRLFILDNLMTIGFKGIGNTDNDKWAAQKRFIIALKHLTKKYPIHIILVAHPKKMEDESKATMYDIHGISEIPNLCDNIIMIRRFTESEREAFAKQKRFIPSVEEKLLKDRFYGRINAKIPIMYDSESGRLHTDNVGPGIRLGWETMPE
ncbi:MAG: AAA family ATPase, partial [Paraclostridium sp.]